MTKTPTDKDAPKAMTEDELDQTSGGYGYALKRAHVPGYGSVSVAEDRQTEEISFYYNKTK